MFVWVIIFIILILTAILGGLFFYVSKEKFRGRILNSLNLKLFLIILPKYVSKEEGKKETEIISIMEQLYSSFYNLKVKPSNFFQKLFSQKTYLVLELSVAHIGEEVSFYLSAPYKIADDVEKQIYSYFPTAKVIESKDYNIFNPTGKSLASYLKLSNNLLLPFKTYLHLETDPLKEITNALSKLKEIGDGAALQIIFRPASKTFEKQGEKLVKMIREGKSMSEALSEIHKNFITKIFNFFATSPKKEEVKQKSVSISEEAIKQIEAKASKVQFETNIRLIASAGSQTETENILRQLENSFSQFTNPLLNRFKINRVSGKKLDRLLFNFAYRIFNNSEKIILSAEELTSIYHFPNTPLETPKIKFLKAKPSEPPVNLPKIGLILGKNIYRGEEKEIKILTEDRRRHLYVIGQTGTGKSTLLKKMISQDIRNDQGVGVFDPHGDLVEDILGFIPKERAEDVILIDPADLSRVIGLNMLEYDTKRPEQKTFIVNELINVLDKLYDLKTTGGPIFEQYTRNALLLLMEYPDRGYTLLEIPKVLSDKEFRKRLLENCHNIIVKDFWEKEAEKAGGEAALQNMVPYITSKFNIFIANDYMRPIIGQSKSAINFREIIDNKKILLVNLSKGKLGNINSSLLGLIIIGKLLMASFSRADEVEEKRQDFYLYLDEFQDFATISIATILSEARKYRLNLIIAHQFIEQLKKEIKDAVFGNVGSVINFRVGAADAEILVKQFFEPVFSQNDLVNVDNFNAYIRLMIDNTTSKPFSLELYPPPKSNPAMAQNLKELSQLKYGRSSEEIEKEILGRR